MKTGTIDIETTPLEAYSFGPLYEARLMKVITPIKLATFCIKELGKAPKVYSSYDYDTYKEFIQELWRVFDTYDILIGHNIKKFDAPMAQAFFAENHLPPPSPYQMIDTLTISRQNFKLPSHSLKYIVSYLQLGEKMETGGEELWFDFMKGDARAVSKMCRYNKQDVIVTEKLFLFLKQWAKTLPDKNVFRDKCPHCGSLEVQKRGMRPRVEKKGDVQEYSCKRCHKRSWSDKVSPWLSTV